MLLLSVPAWAQEMKGVALVIGQSKYEAMTPLVNPNQDARDIDDLLGDLGFDVDRVLNADAEELSEAIAGFIEDAADADVALVYYSGHGIEVAGENYLVPVDADFATPQMAGQSLVAVAPMLDALAKAVPVTIVLLDACRSDPFPAGTVIQLPGSDAVVPVSDQPGLAAVRGPTPVARADLPPESLGTVIGFAAEPGAPALDGPAGGNSPYAAALLRHLSAGGFSFGDVMTMVTEEVYLKARAQQLPWTNSSLRRVLTFEAPKEADPDVSAITGERRKLLLSIAQTPEPTRAFVERLAGQEEVPLDALYGMLDLLGEGAAGGGGDLERQLITGAEKIRELQARQSASVKADPELERLAALAAQAELEGAIRLALDYRDRASARADSLLADKQLEAERLRQDMLDIAATYAANAATAVLNFDHLRAAELYGKAFDAAKDWDAAAAVDYRTSQGDALLDRGYYNFDSDALQSALAVYAEALALNPETGEGHVWAKLHDRIGQVQQTLGTRLAGRTMLDESVASYERALTVRTKEAMPEEWAASKNNLGNTLQSLGERLGDIAMIERAIRQFDEALTVLGADSKPTYWTATHSNRAVAAMALAIATYATTGDLQMAAVQAGNFEPWNLPEVIAARDAADGILTDAVESLRVASAPMRREDDPLHWAMLQNTLAGALIERSRMVSSTPDAEEAVAVQREILTIYSKERTPVQWIVTASNLAGGLRQLASLAGDPAPLAEAIDLFEQSIAMTPRDQAPLDWAELHIKLGNAWSDLVDQDMSMETADKAVAAYRAAAEVFTPETDLDRWQSLQTYIMEVLMQVAGPTADLERLIEARDTAQHAADVLAQRGEPVSALFERTLPVLNQFIELLSAVQVAPTQ